MAEASVASMKLSPFTSPNFMVMTEGALTTVSVSGIAASLAAAVFSDVAAGTAPASAPFAGEASSAGRVPAHSTNDSAAAISLFALISFSFFFYIAYPHAILPIE